MFFFFFFLHAEWGTQLCFAVTLAEIWAVFRNLTATVHVVAMEIATLFSECREAFVLLNGCKEWQNARGRPGMKDVRSGFDLFTECPVEVIFFENGDKLLGTRSLCVPSQESILFMDTAGAFITSECCSIR